LLEETEVDSHLSALLVLVVVGAVGWTAVFVAQGLNRVLFIEGEIAVVSENRADVVELIR